MLSLPSLWRAFSWPAWRQHPARQLTAVLAVTLGVALAFSVQLINGSALSEFGSAVRSLNGEPDLSLRALAGEGFDESVYARVAAHPQVALASPRVEVDTYALDAQGRRQPLRVWGIDALVAPMLSPALRPQPVANTDRLAVLDPGAVFLNPAAQQLLGVAPGGRLQLQSGLGLVTLDVAGGNTAPGGALALMDIAGAQAAFGRLGRLSRIDLRLLAGADAAAVLRGLALPPGVRAAPPDEAEQRLSNVSRAYRVNLTVLALVAMFTGAFLVYSILALSVAQRLPQFALLGVLGLSAAERRRLVLAESALIGLAGSALGVAAGTALAWGALRWLGGDLGGGYFGGATPRLQWSATSAALNGALGVAAALVGGWLPARAAEGIAPAQALKGLETVGKSTGTAARRRALLGPGLMAAGALLALAPPVGGLPLAAYGAVALLLIGGIACVPAGVGLLLAAVRPPQDAAWLLATERARHQRDSATVAVAGVVASLSLAVALTVMVASFRDSVAHWLDTVLPADLYVRTAGGAAADTAWLPPQFVAQATALPGVARSEALRSLAVAVARVPEESTGRDRDGRDRDGSALTKGSGSTGPSIEAAGGTAAPPSGSHTEPGPSTAAPAGPNATLPDRASGLPPPTLIARPIDDPARRLPLVGELLPAAPGERSAYVSEALVALYGAAPGQRIEVTLPLPDGAEGGARSTRQRFFVRGVWRDYARQHGALVVADTDYRALTGDTRVNDLALTLAPGAEAGELQRQLRGVAKQIASADGLLEFARAGEIRAISLRIFDRSFAVTYWLQAVAVGIGLFGIAASFSAQVLARRREFGLLAHLGFTRGQVLAVVAGEGAAWTAAGALLGLALGLAVSVVLVHVVNPQSFHWTMELQLPWVRLAALCAAVMVAGTLTAAVAARRAVAREAVLAVREDW